jgi:hypothetical protein
MAKVRAGFHRLIEPPPTGPDPLVETEPLRVQILGVADKSDPLNQLLSVGFTIGKRVGARAVLVRADHPRAAEDAIAGLILIAIENAAEIRDAIAMERAG